MEDFNDGLSRGVFELGIRVPEFDIGVGNWVAVCSRERFQNGFFSNDIDVYFVWKLMVKNDGRQYGYVKLSCDGVFMGSTLTLPIPINLLEKVLEKAKEIHEVLKKEGDQNG